MSAINKSEHELASVERRSTHDSDLSVSSFFLLSLKKIYFLWPQQQFTIIMHMYVCVCQQVFSDKMTPSYICLSYPLYCYFSVSFQYFIDCYFKCLIYSQT